MKDNKMRSKDLKNNSRRPPSIFDVNDDLSDQDLEAELASLMKSTTSYQQTYKQIQTSQQVNIKGLLDDNFYQNVQMEDSKISDSSDIENDHELLAELDQIMRSHDGPSPTINPHERYPNESMQPSPPKKHQSTIAEPNKMTQKVESQHMPDKETLVATLKERLDSYAAAKTSAQTNGDSSKARRLSRGMESLRKMLEEVKGHHGGLNDAPAGLTFSLHDIPPPVSRGKSTRALGPVEPEQATTPQNIIGSRDQSLLIDLADPGTEFQFDQSQGFVESPNARELGTLMNRGQSATIEPSVSRDRTDGPEVGRSTPSTLLDNALSLALSQQAEFKEQALLAKQAGDLEHGRKFLKVFKEYQTLIDEGMALKNRDSSVTPPDYDLFVKRVNGLPTLAQFISAIEDESVPRAHQIQNSSPPVSSPRQTDDHQSSGSVPEQTQPSHTSNSNFIDELKERMTKYETALDVAKREDNGSKVRRMGRIIKLYQDAIKAYQAGNLGNHPYRDLPNPPGFPEIPFDKYLGPAVEKRMKPEGNTEGPTNHHHTEGRGGISTVLKDNGTVPASDDSPGGRGVVRDYSTHIKQQLQLLYSRQGAFKVAALEAKGKGNITQAKEYLRLMKGFEPLIQACRSGLPIDLNTLPSLPHSSSSPTHEPNSTASKKSLPHKDQDSLDGESIPPPSSSLHQQKLINPYEMDKESLRDELGKLEKCLERQLETCSSNGQYYLHLGDVSSARNFDKMGQDCKRDLARVETYYQTFLSTTSKKSSASSLVRLDAAGSDKITKRTLPPLVFHYETKVLPIVKSNTHLGDNDMELIIVRGYHYGSTANKEMDTYVKYDFPYPSDGPQRDKTAVVYGTNNPEYEQTFKLNIDRKSRSLARCFKRQAIKLEVYLKGGLMRFINGDKLLGTVSLKLAPLEQCATIHECCNLMEGRKEAGGRLEIMVKIRDPLLRKDIEEVREKWLVLD